MATILALDAAWTLTEPSGVALIQGSSSSWSVLAVAPSYDEFFSRAGGTPTDWATKKFTGSAPEVPRLLKAAEALAGTPVDIVTLDMPVASVPFSSRRAADQAISAEFGSRWCSAHSPNATRPGPLGAALSASLSAHGYEIATTSTPPGTTRRLVEVYPHPALLSLLRRDKRVPYKVGKSKRYWPRRSIAERVAALLDEFAAIHAALTAVVGAIGFELPPARSVASLAQLKRYEDALDATICAWVGTEYVAGRAVPLGDDAAAIWCPGDVVHRREQAESPHGRRKGADETGGGGNAGGPAGRPISPSS